MSRLELAEVEDYTVQLEVFKGPLDLLLHLIRQQEIDIYDIPIASITDAYLRYLKMMKDLSISVAGEFVAMAANLIYIKSQMLLPRKSVIEEGEREQDPRTDLVHQLLEHEKFKKAAHLLYEREIVELSVWSRGENEFESQERDVISANVFDLISAFHQVVEEYKEKIVFEVERDPITIEEKIDEIRRLLRVQEKLFFSFFLLHKISRMRLAVTLCALLELAKLKEIKLVQKGNFKDIRILAC